jgi:hypothetical protein
MQVDSTVRLSDEREFGPGVASQTWMKNFSNVVTSKEFKAQKHI